MCQNFRLFVVFISILVFNFKVQAVVETINPVRNFMAFPDENKNYGPGDKAIWDSGLRNNKLVLTFDDGPHPIHTPKILDLLKNHNVKAVFFINTFRLIPGANNYEENLDIVRRIYEEGHSVASHDHNHLSNYKESKISHKAGLKESIKILENLEKKFGVEQREMYFRYPFGAYGYITKRGPSYHHLNVMKEVSEEIYGENCINYVFWDYDTHDWLNMLTGLDIFNNIKSGIYGGWQKVHHRKSRKDPWSFKLRFKKYGRKGGIILLHDIHHRTVEATRLFLEMVKDSELSIIPLNEVSDFQYGDKVCEPSSEVLEEPMPQDLLKVIGEANKKEAFPVLK